MPRFCTYLLLLASLVIASLRITAQVKEIGQLRNVLTTVEDSAVYVDVLNKLGMYYHLSNIDSCFWFATRAREIAVRLGNKKGEAGALRNLGIVYSQQLNLRQAISYEHAALALYRAAGDSAGVCHMMNNLSIDYEDVGDTVTERYYLNQAMAMGNKLPNDSMYSLVLSNYILEYIQDSTKQDSVKWAYHKLQHITARYPYSREWLYAKMFEAVELLQKGQGQKGEQLINRIADTALQKGFLHLAIEAYGRIIDNFIPLGYKADSIPYMGKIFALSQKAGYYERMMTLLPFLYRYYAAAKDIRQTVYYGNGALSLAKHQMALRKSRQEINYLEYFLKEQELQSLQLRNQVQQQAIHQNNLRQATRRALIWFLGALLVLLLIITAVYYRHFRSSRQYERRLADMNAAISEKNRQLRANDDFKNKLISVIAHDFRDPLNNIIRVAAMLQDKTMDQAEMKRTVEQVETSSGKTLAVFDSILRWIKSQLSGFVYAPAPCHVREMMAEALQSIQPIVQEKQVTVAFEVPEHIQVAAEREMLQFVHRTLLSSAVGFSMPGGEVVVQTREEAGAVKVLVKVLKVSITAAMLPHLFEYRGTAYYQQYREHDAELALVICKDFMDKMGGHISAARQQEGFAFVYELPSFH